MPSIKKTSDLVQEITAASEEQTSGVGQINAAVSQLEPDDAAERLFSSEELAATSEEMSSQAEQLQQADVVLQAGCPTAPMAPVAAPAPTPRAPSAPPPARPARPPRAPKRASGGYALNPAMAFSGSASAPDDALFTKF